MNKLDGRVALITGASGGLGGASAKLFASQGAKLILADIDGEPLATLAESLPNAISVVLDVSDESGWNEAIQQTISVYGRLDILVNNAGIDSSIPLLETSLEHFNRMVSVNQTGCFLGMKAAASVMSDGGSIINISSMAGIQGIPGKTAYCASKFAVRGLTKVAALELAARAIRVNSVHPGGMNTALLGGDPEEMKKSGATDIVPLKRVAEPEEVANMVAFLASDDSSYVTGAELVIDGGILAGLSF